MRAARALGGAGLRVDEWFGGPADVRAYFRAQFRGVVAAKAVKSPAAPLVPGLRTLPSDDPYGF